MMGAAVRVITITLMMVWNNPLNLPARLSNSVLAFRPEVMRLIAPSQSAGCLILFIYLFCSLAYLFILNYARTAPGSPAEPREPTGGLTHSWGVGVWKAGSKVTESIACELLSSSSVVTHGGSQALGEAVLGWGGGGEVGEGGAAGERDALPSSLLRRPSLISSC